MTIFDRTSDIRALISKVFSLLPNTKHDNPYGLICVFIKIFSKLLLVTEDILLTIQVSCKFSLRCPFTQTQIAYIFTVETFEAFQVALKWIVD